MNSRKTINRSLQLLLALPAAFAAFLFLLGAVKTQASSSVSVKEVNYNDSTITVQMSAEDSILLISDSKGRKWEAIPLDMEVDNTVTMDISWISTTKDYTLALKGDASAEPVRIIIPKQSTGLRAAYDTFSGTVTFTGETGSIEWRNKEGITWSDLPDEATLKTQLDTMCAYGATLAFRTKGVNGTGIANPGTRPGKEVLVSVPKKIAAPAIKINDATLTIAVNEDMQYRAADSKGNPLSAQWTDVAREEDMPLAELAGSSMVSHQGENPTEVSYIQFRTKATASKQVSNTTTIEIPAQTDIKDADMAKIKVVYTSSTSFEIRVPFAGTTTPYEYCIINTDAQADGVTINSTEDITWKVINSTSPVPISRDKNNAGDGSLVYVRKKATGALGQSGYSLASPAHLIATVKYPGEVSTSNGGLTWLTTVAGRCNANNPDGYLSFELYSPTESVVSEIRFVDVVSIGTTRDTLKRSSNDFTSVVTLNPAPGASEDKKYVITTTIKSTSKLDSFANDSDTRKMVAYITLEDSTEAFESNDERGIGLYILPASKVNNPSGSAKRGDMISIAQQLGWQNYNPDTDQIEYSTSFERIANSENDPDEFRIKVDIGTRNVPSDAVGVFTNEPVTVTAIKAEGYTFTEGTGEGCGFTVEYADTLNDCNEEARMAVLVVSAGALERSIGTRNAAVNLSIVLSNGETLTDCASVTFRETASIVGGPYAWTITENSLDESDKRVEKTVSLKIFRSNYNVSLLTAEWDGHNVTSSIDQVGADITVTFSNKFINTIDVDTTKTNNLTFTFSNGFVLETGFSLTINPGA